MPDHTRRDVLRLTGALTAASAGGLAGCSALPLGGGGGTDTPGFASWLTAPDERESSEDHYEFGSLRPTAILEFEDELADGVAAAFDTEVPIPGIDALGDVERYTYTGAAAVVSGGYERADLVDDLEAAGFAEDDVVSRYTLWEGENGQVVAVSEAAVVSSTQTSTNASADDAVETVVGTDGGDVDRYQAEHEAVGDLLSTLGDAHLVLGSGHDGDSEGFDDALASGVAATFGADETEIRAAVAFEEGEADADDVADWAADAAVFSGGDVETNTDGRTVTATAAVDTGDVATLPTRTPVSPREEPATRTPTASFTYEYERTADGRGLLEITHDGGDSIPANTLYVRGTGFADVPDARQTGPGTWQGSVSGQDARVVSGDRVDVGVSSDYEIDVVWETADGASSATLQSDEGPDA